MEGVANLLRRESNLMYPNGYRESFALFHFASLEKMCPLLSAHRINESTCSGLGNLLHLLFLCGGDPLVKLEWRMLCQVWEVIVRGEQLMVAGYSKRCDETVRARRVKT